MRRHLKIGAGARFECSAKVWRELMKRTTGHVKIGANAKIVILDGERAKQSGETKEA